MTASLLRLLLRLSPPDFRQRCGGELVEAHLWRAGRRGAGARAALAVREVAGLFAVVFRLRATEAARRFVRRHPATGLPGPDPERWAGAFMAGGAIMVVVGESIAWGAGLEAGHVLAPFSMCALAWGLVGRASVNGRMSRRGVTLARLAAMLGTLVAVLTALAGVAPTPFGRFAWLALYPAVLGFVTASIVFSLRGLVTHELPRAPAGAAGVGTLMLATGFAGPPLWDVALVGQYLALAGWIGLGALPWGRDVAPPPSQAGVA